MRMIILSGCFDKNTFKQNTMEIRVSRNNKFYMKKKPLSKM